MELQIGSIVRSRAGHDVGQYFAVVDLDDKFVYICDGRQRPLERTKKKNRLHIAVTKTTLTSEEMQSNKGLRRLLKEYVDNRA